MNVGPFRIVRELGRGASGTVYVAEQERPARRVALKLIALAMSDAGARQRWEREAALLGRLHHPCIAALYAAGITEEGTGWLALELVEGPDLLVHADAAGLDLRARLRLLLAVADAVDHAHRAGVIHCDLKPQNILVDATGRPRILDFGIAAAIGAEAPAGGGARVVGTLACMAPEQAEAGTAPVDERADVYALGLLAFALLARRPPYDLSGLTLPAALHVIRTQPPAKLGSADPGGHDAAGNGAMHGGAARGGAARDGAVQDGGVPWRRALRGDLEAVVAAALEKVPARRTASAAQFAEDLRRYLRGESVSVRTPGPLERGAHFLRRHRVVVGGVLAACMLFGAGTAVAVAGRWRAEQAERREKAAIDDIVMLSDSAQLDQLIAEADTLWPLEPQLVHRIETWLHDAANLVMRLPDHQQALKEWSDDPSRTTAAMTIFVQGELATLVRRIEEFEDKDHGLVREMQRRQEAARTLKVRSLDEPAAAWDAAIASIADPVECPAYGGLVIPRQFGLVPSGRDAGSGLWEFAHLPSGEAPPRDPATGRLVLEPQHGIVLVLVPLDPGAADLADRAYFLGKHEVTQAQWQRIAGRNPSRYRRGWTGGGHTVTELDPVERVRPMDAERMMLRWSLRLPSAHEWVTGACAGTTTTWWTGNDAASLAYAENVYDRTALLDSADPELRAPEVFTNDGYLVHAPVGSFRANPFGLHDMLGNVSELASADEAVDQSWPILRVGGGFNDTAARSTGTTRGVLPPDQDIDSSGVRAARSLQKGPDRLR